MDRPDLDHHWAAGLTFGDLPGEAARHFGDREALLFRDRRYSFRQISQEVDRLARGFIHIGVEPGERVCLWLTNCPEWIFAMFALAKIGAVHVPVNTRFRVADLEYVLAQSEAATLITHDVSGPVDYLAMARALLPAPADPDDRLVRSAAAPAMRRLVIKSDRRHPGAYTWPDLLDGARHVDEAALRARAAAVRPTDTVFIMYTSGTTGFPKGVMRDHSLLRSMLDRHARLGITERDVIINYLPTEGSRRAGSRPARQGPGRVGIRAVARHLAGVLDVQTGHISVAPSIVKQRGQESAVWISAKIA